MTDGINWRVQIANFLFSVCRFLYCRFICCWLLLSAWNLSSHSFLLCLSLAILAPAFDNSVVVFRALQRETEWLLCAANELQHYKLKKLFTCSCSMAFNSNTKRFFKRNCCNIHKNMNWYACRFSIFHSEHPCKWAFQRSKRSEEKKIKALIWHMSEWR